MKKIICMVLLVVMMVTLLTSCGKFTCDLCGEEKTGTKHVTEVLGAEVEICNDCYKGMKEISDAVEDYLN